MKAVASMVTAGYTLCDVGTDHGYVPIALVQGNIIPKAIAVDINKGPLERANEHIRANGLTEQITTRLSNGLEAIHDGEVDSIVIAGMGGELVIHILTAGETVCRSAKELILQPQSEVSKVREYVRNTGYKIVDEDMILEDGKYYPMFRCVPCADVLANTIQQKDFDGRIPQPLKEWAKSVEVCPENASRFLVDKPNPGLTALFVDAFRQQTEAQKEVTSEKTEERDPEVVAWESDEITSIEVKTVEVKPPVVPLPEEAAQAPKAHRLTAEEKEIKAAVMDTLKGQIAYNNDGMRASYRASNHSFNLLARNGVRIEGNTVTQNGEPLFKIHRRHAARKTQGCYRELMPTLEYVRQEQKQEKPSIRDQLRTAAKQQPEKKSPVKSKTHDMEL